jgi:hypothetical protein
MLKREQEVGQRSSSQKQTLDTAAAAAAAAAVPIAHYLMQSIG